VFTPAIMARMIGRQWAVAGVAFKEMAGLTETLDELLVEARELFLARMDDEVRPTPGVVALLDHLDRIGMPRSVCTSSRRAYAERLLGHHGLRHHFAFLLTSDDVTHSKPDPEIYRTAAARFGIDPASLLVLEDSAAGVEAAKAAGAYVVGVPHAQSPAEGLAHADRLIDRLDDPELIGLIGGGNGRDHP
jgi:HAD superfamily hydrolase (TIGR01509 family)